ncbi:hypothetical protein BDN67DRAFT_971809 [Paxillus ammoniavirescens]|nr:hypothetical protein BDN67DRAFT_971809 [Paxillus ammoniavirescens]
MTSLCVLPRYFGNPGQKPCYTCSNYPKSILSSHSVINDFLVKNNHIHRSDRRFPRESCCAKTSIHERTAVVNDTNGWTAQDTFPA